MENKINIAEILKDCPKGMELDCAIYNNVEFEGISDNKDWPIKISVEGYPEVLNPYGCISYRDYTKCVIFPKGKTSWGGFVPPSKFNDGDVVVAEGKACQLFLLKHVKKRENNNGYDGYCYFGWDFLDNRLFREGNWGFDRLATVEEKTKLFETIKANGYKWDEETKTLIKLVEPKFKGGDKITPKDFKGKSRVINAILDNEYNLFGGGRIPFNDQDNWELVSDKFDISTLIPFESRVLVRSTNDDIWRPAMYGFTDSDRYYVVGGIYWNQCIPYKGNEHLVGKPDDCSDYYKMWE